MEGPWPSWPLPRRARVQFRPHESWDFKMGNLLDSLKNVCTWKCDICHKYGNPWYCKYINIYIVLNSSSVPCGREAWYMICKHHIRSQLIITDMEFQQERFCTAGTPKHASLIFKHDHLETAVMIIFFKMFTLLSLSFFGVDLPLPVKLGINCYWLLFDFKTSVSLLRV